MPRIVLHHDTAPRFHQSGASREEAADGGHAEAGARRFEQLHLRRENSAPSHAACRAGEGRAGQRKAGRTRRVAAPGQPARPPANQLAHQAAGGTVFSPTGRRTVFTCDRSAG